MNLPYNIHFIITPTNPDRPIYARVDLSDGVTLWNNTQGAVDGMGFRAYWSSVPREWRDTRSGVPLRDIKSWDQL